MKKLVASNNKTDTIKELSKIDQTIRCIGAHK